MIKVNSRQEILDLGIVVYDEPDNIRISQYGIFYLENDHYPKYFKYFEPYDTIFAATIANVRKKNTKNFLKNALMNIRKK